MLNQAEGAYLEDGKYSHTDVLTNGVLSQPDEAIDPEKFYPSHAEAIDFYHRYTEDLQYMGRFGRSLDIDFAVSIFRPAEKRSRTKKDCSSMMTCLRNVVQVRWSLSYFITIDSTPYALVQITVGKAELIGLFQKIKRRTSCLSATKTKSAITTFNEITNMTRSRL